MVHIRAVEKHIDDTILKSMRRRLGEEDTRKLITKIKTVYPEIKIRTTFIVGYPGETSKQFKKLCKFLQQNQLDYVGFFPYYREEGTASYYMKKQIPTFIKKSRLKKVKTIQGEISFEKMQALVGSEFEVLIDEFNHENGNYIAHSNFMSKDVDFNVEIEDNGSINIGEFKVVTIKSFDGVNLKGEVK